MTLEEGEERVKFLIDLHLHVVMKEFHRGYGLELLGQRAVLCRLMIICPRLNRVEIVDADVLILCLEVDPGEILQLLPDGGGEQHGLHSFGEVLHDLIDGVLETHVEDAVDLVEDEHLQVARVETLGLVHMLEQAAGRAD